MSHHYIKYAHGLWYPNDKAYFYDKRCGRSEVDLYAFATDNQPKYCTISLKSLRNHQIH